MGTIRSGRTVAIVTAMIAIGQVSAPARSAPIIASLRTPQALLEAEDALFAADVNHDAIAIERGFADEAMFVHANGMVQSKAKYVAATRADAFKIRQVTTEDRVATVLGDVGVVHGIKRLVIDGGMHLGGSYLTVYVLRDGRWQMLDEQSAPLPPSVKP